MLEVSPQWLKSAVIYEVSPAKFAGNTVAAIAEGLDCLNALGINAIWLTGNFADAESSELQKLFTAAAGLGIRCGVDLTETTGISDAVQQYLALGATGFRYVPETVTDDAAKEIANVLAAYPEAAFIPKTVETMPDCGNSIGSLTWQLTKPGMAVISCGEEIGKGGDEEISWDEVRAMQKVEKSLWQRTQLLIRLRRRLVSLQSDAEFAVVKDGDPLVYTRRNGSQKLLIVIRKEDQPWDCHLPLPEVRAVIPLTGTWIRVKFPEDGVGLSGNGVECGVFLILKTLKDPGSNRR